MERGEAEEAIKALEEAALKAAEDEDIIRSLESAHRGKNTWWRCTGVLREDTDHATSVAISPDGRSALSGSADRTLRLWDVATGSCLRVFEGHEEGVGCVAVSSDGRRGLSGGWDNCLRLWELATGR